MERDIDIRTLSEVQVDPYPSLLDLGLDLDDTLGRRQCSLERLGDRLLEDLRLYALVRDTRPDLWIRSEERRVGKAGRSRGGRGQKKDRGEQRTRHRAESTAREE